MTMPVGHSNPPDTVNSTVQVLQEFFGDLQCFSKYVVVYSSSPTLT